MRKRPHKVTKEMKKVMAEMRAKGLTYDAIAKILLIASSTVIYHLDPKYKKKTIKRMTEYQQERGDRKEYMKEYMSERYNKDEEFRERIKANSLRSYHKRRNNK